MASKPTIVRRPQAVEHRTNSIRVLVAQRSMLARTLWSDVRGRYAGSVFGLTWLVVYPLLFLTMYASVYLYVFRVRFTGGTSSEYVLLIFCGLIPFLSFADALSTGVSSVSANRSLVKNTMYPIDLAPAKASFISLFTQATGTVMLLAAITAMGRMSPWIVVLPVLWVLQVMMTVGVVWVLAAANVFVRDLQQVIGLVVLFLMMVSPIAYTQDMVPSSLQPFLGVNPLYYMIMSYQAVIFFGRFPSVGVFVPFIALAAGFFVGGGWLFARLKPAFFDNV